MARYVTAEFNNDFNDSTEDINQQSTNELIYFTTSGHCDRLVLMSVLAPIGHTYLTVAMTLVNLLGNTMVEGEFTKLCIKEITERVRNGSCKYGKKRSFLNYDLGQLNN